VDISRSHDCPQLMALYTQSRVTKVHLRNRALSHDG
jgi:hypothetical protein